MKPNCLINMSTTNVALFLVMCVILQVLQQCNAKENVCQKNAFCDKNESSELIGNIETWKTSGESIILKEINATHRKPAFQSTESKERVNDTNDATYENDLLHVIAAKLTHRSMPFDASLSDDISDTCKLHTQMYVEALTKLDLWALQMYDSSAKLPSGLLNGNINQFGDFDECLNVRDAANDITGKYCLAHIQIHVSDKWARMEQIRKLIQSHDAFVSEFNDPGHRVPRFSLINWAVCVPSTCSNIDVQTGMNLYMKNLTYGTGIEYQLRVEEKMCQIKETNKEFDRNTRLAFYFFGTIVLIVILSTALELLMDKPHDILTAFSLLKNGKSLISTSRDPSDISTIHGIRFVNASLLLLSHKSMALFFNPFANRTNMVESLESHISVIGRAAAIYTDAFLLMSGLLTSYSIIGRLQRKQSPRLLQEYAGRLLRIVPTLAALILFCTYILPNMGSGPQWNLVVTHHADICKTSWWKNLLFIHNYYGFDKMCLTHTHHLGIDTELFAIAPPLILILWKWPKNGTIFLLILASISTIGRFYITVAEKLSNYVYFGTSTSQLFRTADYMYSIPFHRATIYILGILLGYGLRTFKHIQLSKTQMRWGWYVSVLLFFITLFGPAPMGNMDYKYSEYHAAIYAAIGPMSWCLLFAWIIFTSHIGHSNILSQALSWKGFLISTKLSYAIYLTQFPIFFYNVGKIRYPGHYQFVTSTINLYEISIIVVSSAILTLLFDSPFQNIKKCIFNRPSTKVDVSSQEVKDSKHL